MKRSGRIQKISLRVRILALFVLTILVSFVSIFVISTQIINKITRVRIETAYENNVTMLTGTIENILDTMKLLSQQIGFGINIAEDITELRDPATEQFRKIQLNQNIMGNLRQLTFSNVNVGLVFFECGGELVVSNFNINKGLKLDDKDYLCRANELYFYGPKESLAGYNGGNVLCLIRKIDKLTPESQDIYVGIETNYDTLEKLFASKEGERKLIFINDQGKVCWSNVPQLCQKGELFSECVRNGEMLGRYRYFLKQSEMGFSVAELVDMELEKEHYVEEYASVFAFMLLFVGTVVILALAVWKSVYSPLRLFDEELAHLLDKKKPYEEERIITTGMQEYDSLLNRIEEMRNQIQEMVQDIVYREEEKSRMKLERLRYQINPHFLMNTLNTIHWMAIMNGQQDIDKAVQALNRLLFYNLDKDGYHTDIERELSAMGEYLLLQKVRLCDLTYTIRKEPENAEFSYPIPKFILQPVIENAIIHGYRDDMHIEVAVCDESEMVEISISDDGLGISEDQLKRIREYAENHTGCKEGREDYVVGIGLEYVIQSLESFYRNDGKKGVFEIGKREPVGTIVKIRVPKIQKERENAEGTGC